MRGFACVFMLVVAACHPQAGVSSPLQPSGEHHAAAPTPLPTPQEGPHAFGALDLVHLASVSSAQLSADGTRVAFVHSQYSPGHAKVVHDIWWLDVLGRGEPTPLMQDVASDIEPAFGPRNDRLFFLSDRGGTMQVWQATLGSETPAFSQVTALPTAPSALRVSPQGTHLVFSRAADPSCASPPCIVPATGATGHMHNELFVRHWDSYTQSARPYLFAYSLKSGVATNLTLGLQTEVPAQPFGGREDYCFTPDGEGIVFSAKDPDEPAAWSTDYDLYHVRLDGSGLRVLTPRNRAWDARPTFSPDGAHLAFLAMKRPGYESDRFALRVMRWPDGPALEVAPSWDRSVHEFAYARDGRSLFVTADNLGQTALFRVDPENDSVTQLVEHGTVHDLLAADDKLVFFKHTLQSPTEPHTLTLDGGALTQRSSFHRAALQDVQFGAAQQFSFAGANGDTVYGYVVLPPNANRNGPAQSVPVALLIHGGPQGSFGNMFHPRWNAQVFAGAGYGTVMIDFHGSTGYGQAFTDAIHEDWGGKPLLDLQLGLQAAIEQFPVLDGSRACALGASYGGFMINWIAGQWPGRFKCLVNHDGLFDQRMMYYTTDELWFPEWDMGGPHFLRPENYERFNPVLHVANWKTPMLVIHGELDYRVPFTQGLATFTALVRRGVPARFLRFPDENHWVLQPANRVQWHDEVLEWLHTYLQ